MRVSVVDAAGRPLMPCHPARVRLLMKRGKALPKRNKLGIFYIQLTYEVEPNNQVLALGVDPGSKFEGFSVAGAKYTVLNIMSEAVAHVKKAVERRRQMRRARRYRKTRCRPERFDNRLKGKKSLPPSTKARWEAKLRIIRQLLKILPISHIVVEDIKAEARKGKRRWNEGFSPVQAGKEHFYRGLRELGFEPVLRRGYETKALREQYGLRKSRDKGKKSFWSHCVDAWVLAASVSGAEEPDHTGFYYLAPLRFRRRQLHRMEPEKGGVRKPYGGTRSLGFKRGTLVRHAKRGLCYVGGHMGGRLSLHDLKTGKRLTQGARPEECRVLTCVSWRSRYVSGRAAVFMTVRILCLADTHLRGAAPASRTDDFAASLRAKLAEAADIARALRADAVAHCGDLFDLPEPGLGQVGEALEAFLGGLPEGCPVYAVPGNHDLYGQNPETLHRTLLGLLVRLGLVRLLGPEPAVLEDSGVRVQLTGRGFHAEIDRRDPALDYAVRKERGVRWAVHIAHGMLLPRALISSAPFLPAATAAEDALEATEADVTLAGHYHLPFDVSLGGRRAVNPGAVARLSARPEEIERTPEVLLLEFEEGGCGIRRLPLSSARPGREVLDRARIDEARAREDARRAFLACLAGFRDGRFAALEPREALEEALARLGADAETSAEAWRRLQECLRNGEAQRDA